MDTLVDAEVFAVPDEDLPIRPLIVILQQEDPQRTVALTVALPREYRGASSSVQELRQTYIHIFIEKISGPKGRGCLTLTYRLSTNRDTESRAFCNQVARLFDDWVDVYDPGHVFSSETHWCVPPP